MTRTGSLYLAVLLCGTALPVLAQEEALNLGTITVLGTGLPTEVFRNPASISVITSEQIEKSVPVSIASLLRDVPGVQISEEGIERISIRGETSRRVAIMIDGQKLTDHTNYGQPILVDPTTVERIEIVRGSSSVVSGSRAMGGVINIITKAGAQKPFELRGSAGYFSATEGERTSLTASGTVDAGAGKLDYRLSFGQMDQDDRKTSDGILRSSGSLDNSRSAHVGYRLDNHYFGLKGQAYDLSAKVYTGDPDFLIDLPNRDLRKFSAFYEGTDLTPWLKRLSVDAYRQTIDRRFDNDITMSIGPGRAMNILSSSDDDQETKGLNIKAEMSFTANSRTVLGFEYEDDELATDKSSVTSGMGPFPIRTLRYDKAKIRTTSVFGQHEVDFTPELTGNIGFRWYDVDAEHKKSTTNGASNPVSSNSDSLTMASAGLVWSPNERLALRGNISQGYIYPTLGQLFLTTTGGGTTLSGNPDLDPEKATTFELGARYDFGATLLDATIFYTDAEDYIATVPTGPTTGTYRNVDSARSWGVEILAQTELGTWGLTPYASVAAIRRELEYNNGYKTFDSGTPTLSGRIGVRKGWETSWATGNVDVFLRGEDSVSFRNDDGEKTSSASGYGTLNLRADAAFGNGFSLVAEINNVTDRSYSPYSQMPGAERSFNLFLSKTF